MRKKRLRSEDFPHLPNCVVEPLSVPHWQQRYPTEQPLWLELAAGKAYFSVEMARLRPDRNVLAMDTRRERMYMGARSALDQQVANVQFVWSDIFILDRILPPGSVSGIWITFPDPYPKERHADRRLTSPRFLDLYRQVCVPGAELHFKTDDGPLFQYSLEMLAEKGIPVEAQTDNLYASPLLDEITGIPTPFEEKWRAQGRLIHYLRARLP